MTLKSLMVALALGLVAVQPALAEEHEHEHEASIGALTVVHPWARAAAAGDETLVFFEIANDGAADPLLGAETDIAASVEIVGATMADGVAGYQPVGAVEIAPGDFDFDPHGLALLLRGLTQDLVQGETFELELEFEQAGHLHLHVEIEAADAARHSHAGHSH